MIPACQLPCVVMLLSEALSIWRAAGPDSQSMTGI